MPPPPQKKPRVAENLGINGKPQLGLGAPKSRPASSTYVTDGKVVVISEVEDVEDSRAAVSELTTRLDRSRGVLLSSSYEYPGRYAQWTLGFANPPLCVECWGRRFCIKALNPRGVPFLPAMLDAVQQSSAVAEWSYATDHIAGKVHEASGFFSEEERSKQPSVFSLIRVLVELFASDEDPHLGLYGAFGYDLAFQFEKIKLHKERDPEQRDLVLYVPDELLVVNHQLNESFRMRYDFVFKGKDGVNCTKGLSGDCTEVPFKGRAEMPEGVARRELPAGKFAGMVENAKRKFECGDLFEAVLSQTFREPCKDPPSEIFHRLQTRNPAPYGFLINLGQDEFIVGASPEMFVRAEKNLQGMRVETCPISGTIRRGKNALEDAEHIRQILTDPKEESEITMCTDVDRNDKSRICEHGTVQVLGRRQIEMYSRLIHTVDHVEGYLRPEFDAIDAFLVHTWAVTVCGAPKVWAMQFVEEMEISQRRWYGAAVGHVAFDGHLNTGLTLRTVRIHDGVGEVRAGATLLFDSVPESEEKETELKASAALYAVTTPIAPTAATPSTTPSVATAGMEVGQGLRVLLIDFEDSFVHTLANYLRQTGAEVVTVRHSQAECALEDMEKLDLAVLSPGPGNPSHFGVSAHIKRLLDRKVRIFGVCLGLQSLVEYFGGKLGQLAYPMHGKPSKVVLKEQVGPIFQGLPDVFPVARYHSLYALRPLPDCLVETACLAPLPEEGATSRNGIEKDVIMGIQHKTLPVAAVQFHPESILTGPDHGLQMLQNAFKLCPA